MDGFPEESTEAYAEYKDSRPPTGKNPITGEEGGRGYGEDWIESNPSPLNLADEQSRLLKASFEFRPGLHK